MKAIFLKEISVFFASITGYAIMGVFLLVNAVYLWLFPGDNVLSFGFADMKRFFVDAPYLFLLLIPALTMRSLAEEHSLGTLELILTKPVRTMEVIFAKFCAGQVLVFLSLLPTLGYLVALVQLSSVESLDWAGIFTSYVGLFLLASVYLAAGIFASALTSNQMVALLLGLGFGLLLTEGIPQLVGLGLLKGNAYYILQLGLSYHYESISRGVIDSRDIVYFISLTALFLLAAKTWIQKRNWS